MTHWLTGLFGWSCLFLLMGYLSPQAQEGRPRCGPYDQAIATITGEHYKEVPFAEAMMKSPGGDRPVRFFANATTGTWTIITQPAPGIACIMMGGENFGPTDAVKPEGPAL